MQRFFIEANMVKDEQIIMSEENSFHIIKVLRHKVGDKIKATDGVFCYNTVIKNIKKNIVILQIESKHEAKTNGVKITLFQSLPKKDKMELIIQKCVELGVHEIIPMETERTIVKIKDKQEKVLTRWNKISEEAAKQCGGSYIPKIKNIMSFEESLMYSRILDYAIIPYENETEFGIKQALQTEAKSIAIFIGPEGGFSPKEIEAAIASSVKPVTLGDRILRTETAGLVAIAITLYEKGEL